MRITEKVSPMACKTLSIIDNIQEMEGCLRENPISAQKTDCSAQPNGTDYRIPK